jgi:hypothetical protein
MRQEKKTNDELSDISDEEISNFIKKLKKGTGKYKGKIPLICFNCGKIGHFSNKCPYPKQEESDDEITFKDQKKIKANDKKSSTRKRKCSLPKNTSSSLKENEEEEPELLFMGIKNQYDNHLEYEEEVNFEEEFLHVIEELRKSKKKNMLLREELVEIEETTKSREKEVSKTISELEKFIIKLKTQLQ